MLITDTKKAKRKFLKSNIRNVLFFEEVKCDHILGEKLIKAEKKDRSFEVRYLDEMIKQTISFLRLKMPINEIAVFSPLGEEIIPICVPYGKIITLVGEEGEAYVEKGVSIRRVKRLKSPPDFVVEDSMRGPSPIFNVPGVHIGDGESLSKNILSAKTLSFKTSLFPMEINTDTLVFLLDRDVDFEYELTSFRKKCPSFLTFG